MTTSFLYDRTSSEQAIAITHNQAIIFHSWLALLNSAYEIGDRTLLGVRLEISREEIDFIRIFRYCRYLIR
jgi:hypothetical protein